MQCELVKVITHNQDWWHIHVFLVFLRILRNLAIAQFEASNSFPGHLPHKPLQTTLLAGIIVDL